ncbi:mitochondrial import receptor subunit TOM6 homolog [Aotus nancymaae]|nr:mitochondrial import receptor subunit TOM6 homolog [Aotus nancymaae]
MITACVTVTGWESRRWDGEQGTVELGRAPPLVELVDAQQGAVPLFQCRSKRTASPAGRWLPEMPDRRCVIRRRRRYGASNEVRAKPLVMASSGLPVSAASSANETPEIPDNVGDWLRGVYRFATDRNDFRRNLILNLGLFAAGVWLARNLSDIDLMAPQPGV